MKSDVDQKKPKKPATKPAHMTATFVNAYHQAPWRRQIQWIGLALLALSLLVLTAGVFLSITARAADVGTHIQELEDDKETLQLNIAEMRTYYGQLTSAAVMKQRAAELGYQPADLTSAIYLIVPEYPGRQTALMAPPPSNETTPPVIIPAYKQSLWEFFFQGVLPYLQSPEGNLP